MSRVEGTCSDERWHSDAMQIYADHNFYARRCLSFASSRRFEEALNAAEHCVCQKANLPKGYYLKGVMLQKLGDIKGAISAFRICHSLAPYELIKKKLDEAISIDESNDPLFAYHNFSTYLFCPTAMDLHLVRNYITGALQYISNSCYASAVNVIIQDMLLFPELETFVMRDPEIWIQTFVTLGIKLHKIKTFPLAIKVFEKTKIWVEKCVVNNTPVSSLLQAQFLYFFGIIQSHLGAHDHALKFFGTSLKILILNPNHNKNWIFRSYIAMCAPLQKRNLHHLSYACYCTSDHLHNQMKTTFYDRDRIERESLLRDYFYHNESAGKWIEYQIKYFHEVVEPEKIVRPICAQRYGMRPENMQLLLAIFMYMFEKHPESDQYAEFLLLLGVGSDNTLLARVFFHRSMAVPGISHRLKVLNWLNLANVDVHELRLTNANAYFLQVFNCATEKKDRHMLFHANYDYAWFLLATNMGNKGMRYVLHCVNYCLDIVKPLLLKKIDKETQALISDEIYSTLRLCVNYLTRLNESDLLYFCDPSNEESLGSEISEFNFEVCSFVLSAASAMTEFLRPNCSFASLPDCLASLLMNLPDEAAFVQYFSLSSPQGWTYNALIILPNSSVYFKIIGEKASIDEMIKKIISEASVADLESMEKRSEKQSRNIPATFEFEIENSGPNMYRELSKVIWDPISKYVEDKKQIIISRTAYTHLVPFEHLMDEKLEYLVSDFIFNYITCSEYIWLNEPNDAELGPSVVFADPNYDLGKVDFRGVPQSKDIFCRLKGAKEEGEICGALLGVAPIMQDAATKSVLQNIQNPPVVLHIASHATFGDLRNDIILAGANTVARGGTVPQGVGNGVLSCYEAADLPLKGTQLVVLSACATGVGHFVSSYLLGFPFALLSAGARCIVVSVSPVDDTITKTFMTSMYTKLVHERCTVNQAVDRARKELRDSGEHLRDYASFIVFGNGDSCLV